MPVPDIAALPRRPLRRRNLVVAAAGNVDHDRLVELVGAAQGDLSGARTASVEPPPAARGARLLPPEGDRAVPPLPRRARHLPRDDDRRFALRVLDTILGGSTSSRLFQEVREKRGLAYAVYSYQSQYVDSGQIGALRRARGPTNVAEAIDVIGARAATGSGPSPSREEELERAKENVKGRTVAVDRVDAGADEPARAARS